MCYKCHQPGHIAKHCRMQIYNLQDPTGQPVNDPTYDWYNEQQQYNDQQWHNEWHQGYQPQQYPLALPAPPQQQPNSSSSSGPVIQAINTLENLLIATLDSINNIDVNNVDLMIDSGAATHVCPPWFGNEFPLNTLNENEKPNLISVTNNEIPVYGLQMDFTSTTRMVKAWSFLSTCAR